MVSSTEPQSTTPEVPLAERQIEAVDYEPLHPTQDGIRLLHLHPHTDKDRSTIRCQLSAVFFSDKPKYEALSYVWNPTGLTGYTGRPQSIFVNDIRIPVTENLYWALDNLRQETTRVIWVDAICINQKNIQERQRQVGMMDYIFSRASQVLIWLGQPYFLSEGSYRPELSTENESFDMSRDFRPMIYSDRLLDWICDNPYWTRLWIIQEAALAKSVRVCISNHSTTWPDFISRIEMHHHLQRGRQLIMTLNEKMNDRHGNSNRLETLLEDFRHAQCSEPRDKIYGFLGLAHDTLDGSIPVDYQISIYDLYKTVMTFFYKRRSALNGVEHTAKLVAFSSLLQQILLQTEVPRDMLPDQNHYFTVTGFTAGRILELGPTYQEMVSSSKADKKWRGSFERYYSSPEDLKTIREANETYSYVLFDNKASKLLHQVQEIDPYQFRSTAWDEEKLSKNGLKLKIEESGIYLAQRPNRRSKDPSEEGFSLQSLRMFLCENRFLGMAPACAKKGDIICLFYSTSVAGLLRLDSDHEGSGTYYRVIGRVHLSTGSLEGLKPVYKEWNEPPPDAKKMTLRLEIRTLAALTC